jgi:LacI family transcriptional regulator
MNGVKLKNNVKKPLTKKEFPAKFGSASTVLSVLQTTFFHPSMGVTIYDLAREAGVGIGTVSRCLNNHPSVSSETREKVLSVVKRLSYQPHAYAQRLASRKTNTFSAIIPFFTNYFFIQVLQGIQDKAAELGFDLVLYGVNDPSQADYYLRRSLQRGRVDGVLYFSMALPESYAAKFSEMQVPLILVDTSHPQFDSFRVRNREGEVEATRHLLSLGHRDIAFIDGSPETRPGRERLEGFRQALMGYGLSYSEDCLFVSGLTKQDGFSRESGRESMKRFLGARARGTRFSAVVVASDIQALGALEVARENGVRVPEDIAMVGFDDIELAQHVGLTTMRQPMHEMGMLAVERLLDRIKDPTAPPSMTTFMPDLIVRSTCGASCSPALEPITGARGTVLNDQRGE